MISWMRSTLFCIYITCCSKNPVISWLSVVGPFVHLHLTKEYYETCWKQKSIGTAKKTRRFYNYASDLIEKYCCACDVTNPFFLYKMLFLVLIHLITKYSVIVQCNIRKFKCIKHGHVTLLGWLKFAKVNIMLKGKNIFQNELLFNLAMMLH